MDACQPWVTGQEIADCYDVSALGTDLGALDTFIDTATDLLFDLSGRRFVGECEQTVRPCSSFNGCFQVLSRGHVVWNDLGWWGWDNWGSWWGDRTGGRVCGCWPVSRILLAGVPVTAVTEVTINGAIVDPTSYELRDQRWLVRINDALGHRRVWPACQDMGATLGDDGTFGVTYTYGKTVPESGVAAAAELAYQLWLKCNGQPCDLPDGVTRVTRQQVTFEKPAFISWAHQGGQSRSLVYGWHTGLTQVDSFLNSKNSSGLRRRPAVMSPDLMYPERIIP